jgi:hypothetical protein
MELPVLCDTPPQCCLITSFDRRQPRKHEITKEFELEFRVFRVFVAGSAYLGPALVVKLRDYLTKPTVMTTFGARWTQGFLGVVFASCCACSSPSAPSSGQIAGAWVANSTLAAVSGGECVGSTLEAALGSRDVFTTALQQAGTALEATVASQGNGTSCAYAGTVGSNLVALNMTTCQNDRVIGVRCGSGALRDLQLVSGAIAARVSARTSGAGTDTSTWNVFVSGTTPPVATLTLTASFSWIFLGVPSSDYHVFTGTIFPGYADGTISIEGTDAFCSPCGWFPR